MTVYILNILGVERFNKPVSIGDVFVNGTWDGINITELYMKSVNKSINEPPVLSLIMRNSTEETEDFQSTTVNYDDGTEDFTESFVAESADKIIYLDDIDVTYLKIIGNLSVQGLVSTLFW